jgi:tRNA (guanine-N7-)-methyltransferase
MPEHNTAPSKPSPDLADVEHPRHIRSFVRRAGRLTVGQSKALTDLGPRYQIPFAHGLLDLPVLQSTMKIIANNDYSTQTLSQNDLKTASSTVLEIGFGMGEATAHIAKVLPNTLFLACEVHEPGVGALLKRISEQEIANIRIIAHDAVQVLEHMIPKDSLDGIHIFFPDPWHKKRHNKRRLLQPPFVATLVQHLKPGGYLHCATDWQPYAEQMLEVLSAQATLVNSAADYADKPHYRPLTKFENRGIKLGHGVWDLVFKKQSAS